MLKKLSQTKCPEHFNIGKPVLPTITPETTLTDLIGPESYTLLHLAKIADAESEVQKWADGDGLNTLEEFKSFLGNLVSINDYAERNIRLIQDFISKQKTEDMRQNLLLVARDSRKKLKKDMPKSQLKKSTKRCVTIFSLVKCVLILLEIEKLLNS